MSRAQAKADQRPLGAYYTPDDVARKCVAVLNLPEACTIVEPSVGGGSFARALDGPRRSICGYDINQDAPGQDDCDVFDVGDWLAADPGLVDWIVGNPPFQEAEAHVRHAIEHARVGCAFLLRLAFLESEKRAEFWRLHPPAEVHILTRRPSFTGGGTDSAAYAFFVWRRGSTGKPVMSWI